MDKLSQWIALTVAGCLAVVAGGWFLLVSPVRAQAEEVRAQVDAEEAGNDALRAQLAMLKARAKDLPSQQAALAEVAAKVPTDPALPLLIRALDRASDEAGVELLTLAPGAPQSAAPVAAAPVTSGEDSDGVTTVAPAAPSGPALTRIPLSVDVVGGYFQVQQFLNRLEGLDRALRVTGLSVSPGASPVDPDPPTTTEDGRSLKATVTGEVFFAPAAPGTASASRGSTAGSTASGGSASGSTASGSSTTSGSASAGDAVPN